MSNTESTGTAGRRGKPLDGRADLDQWVAREDRYQGKHREQVQR